MATAVTKCNEPQLCDRWSWRVLVRLVHPFYLSEPLGDEQALVFLDLAALSNLSIVEYHGFNHELISFCRTV